MKTINEIVKITCALLLLFQCSNIYADDCADCRTNPYCYVKCAVNSNNKVSWMGYCTNDPYSPPGSKPYKKCLPATTQVDSWPYDWSKIWFDMNGDGVMQSNEVLFDANNLFNIAEDARVKYESLCSSYSNTDCSSCPLKITFVKSETDIKASGGSPASDFAIATISGTTSPCSISCISVKINVTPAFLQSNVDGSDDPELTLTSDRRYSIRPLWTEPSYNGGEIVLQNARLAIMQLVAYMMGFAWQGATCGSGCNTFYKGMMWSAGLPDDGYLANTSSPTNTTGASDYCMFKLLYCCNSATGVTDESAVRLQVNVNGVPGSFIVTDGADDFSALSCSARLDVNDLLGKPAGTAALTSDALININTDRSDRVLFLRLCSKDGICRIIKVIR